MQLRIETVQPNDLFWKVLGAHTKRTVDDLKGEFLSRHFMALDPGQTTGIASWEGCDGVPMISLFQYETNDVGQAYQDLHSLISQPPRVDHVRCEEYRVYNWMADQHSWSILHTPQLIGAIKVMCHLESIPLSFKLAQMAKAVWNDNILKQCDLYSPGLKHARDACRHLLYYMCKPDDVDDERTARG